MPDPEPSTSPPKSEKDSKGRFLPGHKFVGGRKPGVPNKCTGLRETLLAGITQAGLVKAKKAGRNEKVDGLLYYVQDLATHNPAAAGSLLSKLIPAEAPPEAAAVGTAVVTILPVISGTWFAPEVCKELARTGRLPEGAKVVLLEPKVDAPLIIEETGETVETPETSGKVAKVVVLRRPSRVNIPEPKDDADAVAESVGDDVA